MTEYYVPAQTLDLVYCDSPDDALKCKWQNVQYPSIILSIDPTQQSVLPTNRCINVTNNASNIPANTCKQIYKKKK